MRITPDEYKKLARAVHKMSMHELKNQINEIFQHNEPNTPSSSWSPEDEALYLLVTQEMVDRELKARDEQ